MDLNIQKEEFSYAYINSIVSAAGFSQLNQTHSMDISGVDITIQSADKPFPKLDVQVKCTSDSDIINVKEESIVCDLPVRNYNQLIDKQRLIPLILILVWVPDNISNWVVVEPNKSETIVKKCAYWISLKGENTTDNNTKIRIKIPLKNLFTPDSVKLIMNKIGRRQEL